MTRFFLTTLLLCLLTGCRSTPEHRSEVLIADNANLLSAEMEKHLAEIDYCGLLVSIVTVEELPMEGLNAHCVALFEAQSSLRGEDFAREGLLVIGSARPNLAVAKFGSAYEEWGDGRSHYGSAAYFLTQMHPDLSPEKKIVEVLQMAVNSAGTSQHWVGALRNELFGTLYTGVVRPDESFFYRYVLYPMQWPFVQMLRLTHSFVVSILLVAALLFLLYWLCARFFVYHGVRKCYADPKHTKLYVQQMNEFSNLSGVLFFLLPMTLGALSLSVSIGVGGVEFLASMVEHSGLPLVVACKTFGSGLMQQSWGLAVLAAFCYYIASYDPEISWLAVVKMGALFFVAILASKAVALVLFLLFLPQAYFNFSRFWDDTYKTLRVNGISRYLAAVLAFLKPIVGVVGIALGCYDGFRDVDPFVMEQIATRSEAPAPETVSVAEALERWNSEA